MDIQAYNLMNQQNQICPHTNHLLTSIFTSDALLNHQVLNIEDRIVGDINEIIIDTVTGKICYAFILSKFEEKLIAIPWDAILYDVNKKLFSININVNKFKSAPSFDIKNWPNLGDEKWAESIHSYFGIPMKHSNSIHSAM